MVFHDYFTLARARPFATWLVIISFVTEIFGEANKC